MKITAYTHRIGPLTWALILLSGLLLLGLCATACSERAPTVADRLTIDVWIHSGQQSERETLRRQVAQFNALQDEIDVKLTVIPQGSYNGQIQAAALAGDLPDLLEFDGPYIYNYVWQNKLRPLDELLSPAILQDLLPSIIAQGTYRGRLYSVGTFDSGVGLYGRRAQLKAIGARIPKGPQDAWTADEFEHILHKLANTDADGAVLDLKLNYQGEWFSYGFSPIIQSAGGDLIERDDYETANGVLNGPDAVNAMRHLQSWITAGYVDPNLDDAAFVSGRVALSWVGHWEYRRYSQAIGDDLVLLPLPDFGHGSKSGQGSWNWGISTASQHPSAAVEFLAYLLQPEQVLTMANVNGAVPATHSAVAQSEVYGPKGPLHLFARNLQEGYAVPRPRTPAYPIISSAFEHAFLDIRNGADVQASLDEAVRIIDQDIRDNHGYRPVR